MVEHSAPSLSTTTVATRQKRSKPADAAATTNRRLLNPVRRRRGSFSPPPTSIPIGSPIPCSIPRWSFSGASSSSTMTGTNTCLYDSTALVSINPWWNSAPSGLAGQSPSFSTNSDSTRWWNVYLRCNSLCIVGTGSPGAKASTTFGYKRHGTEGRPDCVWAQST